MIVPPFAEVLAKQDADKPALVIFALGAPASDDARLPHHVRRGYRSRQEAGPLAGRRRPLLRVARGGRRQGLHREMDDEVYATPAIAYGHVFIRTRGALYCFGP